MITLSRAQRVWCILTGLVFLIASVNKSLDPQDFQRAIHQLIPSTGVSAHVIGMLLVFLEATLGTLLLLQYERSWPAWSALLLLITFTSYLFWLQSLANPPDCGCLGKLLAFEDARTNVRAGMLRNGILIASGAALMLVPGLRKVFLVPSSQR